MTDLADKFAADHAATWAHTERDWSCVGRDTSYNDFTGVDNTEDNDDE